MRSCSKTYTITEYGGFTRGTALCGYQGLPERTFDALETFILANRPRGADAIELLSLSTRRGVGKIITARNYVGLITMADGTAIEILPKIAGDAISITSTKRVFLEMLKTLKDVAFKDFDASHLCVDRLSLLEVFVKMFLDEVATLVKQGLKAAYSPIEENERFYKGKLLASQNIKYNVANKARFFVRHDDFNMNRPENKLIKSTLGLLRKATGDACNRRSAARLLAFFQGVECSKNYDADFARCSSDRNMSHYGRALSWCRIFLQGNSFTAFAGSEVALALLFPMEKVFESFIAAKLRKHVGGGVDVRVQDARYSLFDSPTRAFALRPDIVLEADGNTVVVDTKWKLLSDASRNRGISQSDMYQMYAYAKKYHAERVVLLYPRSDAANNAGARYTSDDNVDVQVSFVDLENVDGSIFELLAEVACV